MNAQQLKKYCKNQCKRCKKNILKLQCNNEIINLLQCHNRVTNDECLFLINCSKKIWSKIIGRPVEYCVKNSYNNSNLLTLLVLKYLCGIKDTDIVYSFYGDIQWFFDLPKDYVYTEGMLKDSIVINDRQINCLFSINCSDFYLCKFCINCSLNDNCDVKYKFMTCCYDCINCYSMNNCISCTDCNTCVNSKFLTDCKRVYNSSWCNKVHDSDKLKNCLNCNTCYDSYNLILCTDCMYCNTLLNCKSLVKTCYCINDLKIKHICCDKQVNCIDNICNTNFKSIVNDCIPDLPEFITTLNLKKTYDSNIDMSCLMKNKMTVLKSLVPILQFSQPQESLMFKYIIDINDDGWRIELDIDNNVLSPMKITVYLYDTENNLVFTGLLDKGLDVNNPLDICLNNGTFYYPDIATKMCDISINSDYHKFPNYVEDIKEPWELGVCYYTNLYTNQLMKNIVKQRQLTIRDVINCDSDFLMDYVVNHVLSGEYSIIDVYDRNSKFVYSYSTFAH